MGELDGYTAVVTGSSSGIGRAVALELAAAGADVLVHAGSRRDAAEAVADKIRELGRQARVELVPLEDPQQHGALVEAAWAWRGNVDVWINNAGADVLTGEASSWDFDRKLERLWQVDVRATIRLSRLVGARMKAAPERRQRVILNMGWDQAQTGMAGDSGEMFAAAKGAVMSFSGSLAKSLAPQVRVNCLAPGWIKTAWGEQASSAWQQQAISDSLLDRWGTPEDVARAARFLASPAAEFINGQIVSINGGLRGA
jgi:3-oxoacyl-[acyl-carrier protein] reductase